MQLDVKRVYFNAVLGGLGGLAGWALISKLVPEVGDSPALQFFADAWKGALIGTAIGAAVGASDGLVANRSTRKLLRGAGYGAMLGAAGGAIGIVLGGLLFTTLGGGLWGKAIGWALLGALVGTCDGVAQNMPLKVRYGALGGLLGGLIGGSTYERVARLLIGLSGDRAFALALGGAIGLLILGACIGALMGLVESLLRTAWLIFTRGSKEGQTETLDPNQPRVTLGRATDRTIVLRDKGVSDCHAVISAQGGKFAVAPDGGAIVVEGKEQVPFPVPLDDGDAVALGASRFIFHVSEG